MPGLDIGHIALLLGIAFVIFGPERLQEVARTLGQTLNDLRRASDGLPDLLNPDAQTWEGKPGAEDSGSEESAVAAEPGTMPLMDHIGELRKRLLWGVIPILVAATVCFFFSDFILKVLKAPAGPDFVINAFGPMDGFLIRWKVALWAALVVSSPFWIYQLIAFLSPGLTRSERRFLMPTLIGVACLFIAGTVFGYVLLQGMLRVMLTMYGNQINYLPNASQYLSFVVFFMLACALVFELPAVLLVLVRFGVIKPEMLRRQRKIAYFLLFAFAEVITPVADPIIAPMIVMVPLVILYEAAIFATRWALPPVATPQAAESAEQPIAG